MADAVVKRNPEPPRGSMQRPGKGTSTGQVRRAFRLFIQIALGIVAVWFITSGVLDAHVETTGTGAPTAECRLVRGDDSLVQLSRRWPAPNLAGQLERWEDCDRSRGDGGATVARAQRAVRLDLVFTAALTVLFALSVITVRRHRRWRLAGGISAWFVLIWAGANLLENSMLLDLLDEASRRAGSSSISGLDVPSSLRWISAVRSGTLLAATPVVVVSVAMSFADLIRRGELDARVGRGTSQVLSASTRRRAARSFAKRWGHRLTNPRSPIDAEMDRFVDVEPDPARPVGVCSSGGGIRSAAFSLGAFQSFDEHGELDRTRWLTCVSGGAYMAAAWVTGRSTPAQKALPSPTAWQRHSPEEHHLRRHASYLAPGGGGKLWAVARFTFGLALNLGLVMLAFGTVFLPYGWLVHRYQVLVPATAGGVVTLPSGGCIERPDGTFAIATAGERVSVLRGTGVALDPNAPPIRPPTASRSTPTSIPAPAPAPPAAAGRTDVDCSAVGATTPRSGALPAAATNRLLREGWTVTLDVASQAVALADELVRGCLRTETPCRTDALVTIPRGSRLVQAGQALLELGEDAVATDNQLVERCGLVACERWRTPAFLVWAVRSAGALAGVVGLFLVFTRLESTLALRVEAWARKLVAFALVFALFGEVVPRLVSRIEEGRRSIEADLAPTLGAGGGVILLALVSRIVAIGSASGAQGTASAWLRNIARSLWRRAQPLLVRMAGYLAGPLLLVAIALLFAGEGASRTLRPSQLSLWAILSGFLAMVLAAGDLNEWSLHPFYRDRLKTAFAADPSTLECRVDPLDGLPNEPELLICAAANIADARLTAPGRPVVSWTFSRSEMGSPVLGTLRPISSGTVSPQDLPSSFAHLNSTWSAVAVSGAAISPSMGKMSRAERVLLALGNVRLGQWYPNPRLLAMGVDEHGTDRVSWYETHHPRPWYLAKEALGLHSAGDPWVYVTDGAHYEGLGLVELLRRRCLEIYCLDAAGEATDTFGALADAMRIARGELGVTIEIDPLPMASDADGISKVGAWAGVVRYPATAHRTAETGWVVLAKLAVPKDAPFDIRDLARTLPGFPNHPTADQLFTDQKFEAYRALGAHLAEDAHTLAQEIRRAIARPMAVDKAVKNALAARTKQPSLPSGTVHLKMH